MIELSKQAKKELKEILIKDIGQEAADGFTDEELNHFGVFCLIVPREGFKMETEEENKLS